MYKSSKLIPFIECIRGYVSLYAVVCYQKSHLFVERGSHAGGLPAQKDFKWIRRRPTMPTVSAGHADAAVGVHAVPQTV